MWLDTIIDKGVHTRRAPMTHASRGGARCQNLLPRDDDRNGYGVVLRLLAVYAGRVVLGRL
jgi:hypothetical protein